MLLTNLVIVERAVAIVKRPLWLPLTVNCSCRDVWRMSSQAPRRVTQASPGWSIVLADSIVGSARLHESKHRAGCGLEGLYMGPPAADPRRVVWKVVGMWVLR